jgi:hypothetical protein
VANSQVAFSISVAISPGQLHNLILLVIIKSVNFTIAAAAAPTHYKGWIRVLELGFINARISVHEVKAAEKQSKNQPWGNSPVPTIPI